MNEIDRTFLKLIPKREIEKHLDIGTRQDNKVVLVESKFTLYNEVNPRFIPNIPQPCFYGNALDIAIYFPQKWFDLITSFVA